MEASPNTAIPTSIIIYIYIYNNNNNIKNSNKK